MNFLLFIITTGTQKGPKIIVKVAIGQFGPTMVQKIDSQYCNYLELDNGKMKRFRDNAGIELILSEPS